MPKSARFTTLYQPLLELWLLTDYELEDLQKYYNDLQAIARIEQRQIYHRRKILSYNRGRFIFNSFLPLVVSGGKSQRHALHPEPG